jgi:hypothetical protein
MMSSPDFVVSAAHLWIFFRVILVNCSGRAASSRNNDFAEQHWKLNIEKNLL